MGAYRDVDYYDTIYSIHASYAVHYSLMGYLPVWQWMVARLQRDNLRPILEIGCGTGQFAQWLWELGWRGDDYRGFDFSPTAIRVARSLSPQAVAVGDARDAALYRLPYQAVVCCETLEHIEDDVGVIRRVRPGTRVLLGVPTQEDFAHIRRYTSLDYVARRFDPVMEFHECELVAGSWACHATRRDR